MKRGYIRVWRKFQNDPLWKEKRTFSRAEAWLDLLLQASGTDREIKDVDGEDVFLKRGQFLSSARELAKRWRWSKSRAIRFLNMLKMGHRMGHRIDVKMGHRKNPKMGQRKSIITIRNYNKYNPLNNESGSPRKSGSGSPEKKKSGSQNGSLFKEGLNKKRRSLKEDKIRVGTKEERETLDKDHLNFLDQLPKD